MLGFVPQPNLQLFTVRNPPDVATQIAGINVIFVTIVGDSFSLDISEKVIWGNKLPQHTPTRNRVSEIKETRFLGFSGWDPLKGDLSPRKAKEISFQAKKLRESDKQLP